ncbi:MAG: S41 family peptidase [Bacteroidaceae bacterium]|nr:S41 family peptidase [Bacteroidaceae bacterium]
MKRLTFLLFYIFTWCLALHAQDDRTFSVLKNLDVFHNIYRNLDAFYVDTLDADKVIKVGIDAMLHSLDPYTEYYPEEDQSELKMLTQAKYGGIGSVIRMMKDSTVIIAEPYEGMPAAEVGLQVGDVLLKVDDKDLKGMGTPEVSNLLRGEPGTTFVLKFQRPNESKPREVKITRQNIKLSPIPYYGLLNSQLSTTLNSQPSTLNSNIGYINLSQFTNDCYSDVRKAIISLKSQGAKSLIFDLRGNPGGALDQAVRIVNLFVPKDITIVETKGKVQGGNQTYKTMDQPLDEEIPIVVMVNNNSASASEIVAGSLQDLDRAVILGSRTYGKGLVQSIRELPYNGNLKLTTAKYYIPSGRCIQEIDYKQKRERSNQKDATADSTVYRTRNGRPVLSGKGIKPDVEVEHDTLQNIVYYLSNEDVLINYGTKYCQTHPAPKSVADFKLTDADFEDFKKMVIESDFKYDRLSEKRLEDLKKVAEFEGYYEDAKAEFDALEAKLTHNLSHELDHHAKDIRSLISLEIIKRYFFESGSVQEMLKDDTDLPRAIEILSNMEEYNKILNK